MPAYLVGIMDITDPEEFARYSEAAGRAMAPFQGKFRRLASTRNNALHVYEGTPPSNYMFIFEFESRELFDQFYNSPQYQEAIAIRLRATKPVAIMLLDDA